MGGSFKGKKTHYDDKPIGSTYENPGVGKGAKGKHGTGRNAPEPKAGKGRGRNASDRFAPKGFGNVGCYDEDKYLNEGRPLNGGSGFFKDKKKKSFNPNFDNDNHNRKNRYNSGDKNNRGGRGNQGRNEGRGRRR